MGANSFFSMLGSHDPMAQAFHLPGAGKYAQSQSRGALNNNIGAGPYAGQPATLAGANAGYTGLAPGATSGMNAYAAAAGQRPVGTNATWQQGQISPMQSR
jgi:hypothetical protein